MAASPYQRLPGRSSGLLAASSLWETDDHLLLVESYRVSEGYRRFFLRDIQAILICQTSTGLVTTLVLGGLAVILAAGAFLAFSSPSPVVAGMLGGVAGLFALLALIEFLRGPTCRSTLRTAVQVHPLPSLNRVRTARRVVRRLQSKIEAAQGEPLGP